METNEFTVAVTFGRFNIPHYGHLDLFKKMSESADQIIIGLSEGPDNIPVGRRLSAVGNMVEAEGINFQLIPAPQPFEFFRKVDAMDFSKDETALWLGHDQIKLALAAQKVMGWSSRTIERLTSSTEVRDLIDREEWDLLSKRVPPSIFNEVLQLRHLEINSLPF
mgnify:FL=1